MHQVLALFLQGFKAIARRIGELQSRVVLTLLYFLLFAPLTLIVRAKDPLGLKEPPGWRPYHSRSADLPSALRQ